MYSHSNPSACVWKCAVAIIDNQCVLTSVCSQGQVISCLAAASLLKKSTAVIVNQGYIEEGDGCVTVNSTPELVPPISVIRKNITGNISIMNRNSFYVLDICYMSSNTNTTDPLLVYGGNNGVLIIQSLSTDCMMQ